MEVLYFAFANDPTDPLPTLQQEADELNGLLSDEFGEEDFLIHFEAYANPEKLRSFISSHQNNIRLFYYSEHSGQNAFLQNIQEKQELFQLLDNCPQLDWLFLNGCATKGDVKHLMGQRSPKGVVATSIQPEAELAFSFSKKFFSFLKERENIHEAFNKAKSLTGEVNPNITYMDIESLMLDTLDPATHDDTVWGLYTKEEQNEILEWRFPQKDKNTDPTHTEIAFTPNVRLIEELYQAIVSQQSDKDHQLTFAPPIEDQRLLILKSFPEPISEQLRKLFIPIPDQSLGYDKPNFKRLLQLLKTYRTSIELYSFILLAQLWKFKEERPDHQLDDEMLNTLRNFIKIKEGERNTYSFLKLITPICQFLESCDYPLFIEEMKEVDQALKTEIKLKNAIEYLERLNRQYASSEIAQEEVPLLCKTAEHQLGVFLTAIAFLVKYSFKLIRSLDIIKWPQQELPASQESSVSIAKVEGGRQSGAYKEMDEFIGSRSVILVKKQEDKLLFLNLSPFILDQNAFEERPAEIAKIYFFHHFQSDSNECYYYYSYKSEDEFMISSDFGHYMAKVQFDTFCKMIFGKMP